MNLTPKDHMAAILAKTKAQMGLTLPNPATACRIIKNGKIIGEGVHLGPGTDHAEVAAIKNSSEDPEGATLIVNLEPCTHFGKTPPCVNAIIEAKIKNVIYATKDPNPKVGSNPAKVLLEAQGIHVTEGCLGREALELNLPFFSTQLRKRPYVVLKAGLTLDGKIALSNGVSKYITGPESRIEVHKTRFELGSVLIGAKTALVDNPGLTVRDWSFQGEGVPSQPQKIILDPKCELQSHLNIFKQLPPPIIVVPHDTPADYLKGVSYHPLRLSLQDNRFNWADILNALYEINISGVLIEGGASILGSALAAGIADEIHLFYAPLIAADQNALSAFTGNTPNQIESLAQLSRLQAIQVGQDILIKGISVEPISWAAAIL